MILQMEQEEITRFCCFLVPGDFSKNPIIYELTYNVIKVQGNKICCSMTFSSSLCQELPQELTASAREMKGLRCQGLPTRTSNF